MIVVVVMVVMVMCIRKEQNLCWSRSLSHTLKTKKSLYVIVGPL